MKFHAIAVGTICVVVVLLYWIIGPTDFIAPGDPDQGVGDHYVHIVDATWGLNCNTEINRLRALGQTSLGEGASQRPLVPVNTNNAIFAVTELCNDKMKCNILAANDTLGIDPLSTCYKQLVVGYRCFSVDRKWTRKTDQGTIMTIDCSPDIDQSKAVK